MKKNGFTLAEVLITLAIIGVVATITLPSLMSNTQEQQAVTAFRKSMNTLNEVAQMNAAVDGFDFGGIDATASASEPKAGDVYDGNGVLQQSVWGMMYSKAQVDVTKSGKAGTASAISPGGACQEMSYVIAFRDGTMLCYMNNGTNGAANTVINAVVDTNGKKAPNAMSTCGDVNCATKSTKNIRDQFAITLYNSMAIPGRVTISANGGFADGGNGQQNNAARWAMSK